MIIPVEAAGMVMADDLVGVYLNKLVFGDKL